MSLERVQLLVTSAQPINPGQQRALLVPISVGHDGHAIRRLPGTVELADDRLQLRPRPADLRTVRRVAQPRTHRSEGDRYRAAGFPLPALHLRVPDHGHALPGAPQAWWDRVVEQLGADDG